eukprot:481474_1
MDASLSYHPLRRSYSMQSQLSTYSFDYNTLVTRRSHNTFTKGHCFYVIILRYILFLSILGSYAYSWVCYVRIPDEDIKEKISILHLTYFQSYYVMQIALQVIMVAISSLFFIQITLYADDYWLKTETMLHTSQLFIHDHHILRKICSIKFCCRLAQVVFTNLCTTCWNETHILALISFLYYSLAALLIGKHVVAAANAISALGITMSTVSIHLLVEIKRKYINNDRFMKRSEPTLYGDQWEKTGISTTYSVRKLRYRVVKRKYEASTSILNDEWMRFFIAIAFILQIFAFIIDPVAQPKLFLEYISSLYCSVDIKYQ